MPTVLITGASSGIGHAAARAFLDAGYDVAATMRSPDASLFDASERLITPRLDVLDQETIESAVAETRDRFGGIDVVLNNAGYGVQGPFEALSIDQITRQIETNVLGLMRVTAVALPILHHSPHPVLINMSSVSGRLTIPFYSLYHASKWAVEGFSESLAYELRPLGIRVRIIEAGPVETAFYGRSMDNAAPHERYEALLQRADKVMRHVISASGSPEVVARTILRSARSRSWRLRYGAYAFGLPSIVRMLPTRLVTEITQRLFLGNPGAYR